MAPKIVKTSKLIRYEVTLLYRKATVVHTSPHEAEKSIVTALVEEYIQGEASLDDLIGDLREMSSNELQETDLSRIEVGQVRFDEDD